MKRGLKFLKWFVIVIACGALLVQFIRPARTNPVSDQSQSISARLEMKPEVASILERSCGDCHSNNTRWPWYSNVSPVSWFVTDHVNHGRRIMNLSEWDRYDRQQSLQMLGMMCKTVQTGFMPLNSYLQIHQDARLSVADVKVLCEWTAAERARISGR